MDWDVKQQQIALWHKSEMKLMSPSMDSECPESSRKVQNYQKKVICLKGKQVKSLEGDKDQRFKVQRSFQI